MSKVEAAAIQIGDNVRVSSNGLEYEGNVAEPGLVGGDFFVLVSRVIQNTVGADIAKGRTRKAYHGFVIKQLPV